jgi:predicted ATPase
MRREGSQVLVATHSPLLVHVARRNPARARRSVFRTVNGFEELELVQQWRAFLSEPERYFRNLFGPADSSSDDGA